MNKDQMIEEILNAIEIGEACFSGSCCRAL